MFFRSMVHTSKSLLAVGRSQWGLLVHDGFCCTVSVAETSVQATRFARPEMKPSFRCEESEQTHISHAKSV
eukprot:6194829-Pleurochrysis_carterae.AAC.2